MKILVIEDELATVRGYFELANLYAFDGNLQITFVVKSQDVNFQHMNEYAVVFVDISLANNSQMDGFSIMKKIHDEQPDILNKTIILTGNNKIEEKLQEQDVDFQKIKIVYKPASYKTIASVIKEKTERH